MHPAFPLSGQEIIKHRRKGWSTYFTDNNSNQKILILYMAAQTGKIIYEVAFISLKKTEKRSIYSLIPKGSVSEQIQKTNWFYICQFQRGILNSSFTGALGELLWFEGFFLWEWEKETSDTELCFGKQSFNTCFRI